VTINWLRSGTKSINKKKPLSQSHTCISAWPKWLFPSGSKISQWSSNSAQTCNHNVPNYNFNSLNFFLPAPRQLFPKVVEGRERGFGSKPPVVNGQKTCKQTAANIIRSLQLWRKLH